MENKNIRYYKENYYVCDNQFQYKNGDSACIPICLIATIEFLTNKYELWYIEKMNWESIMIKGIEIWKKWKNSNINNNDDNNNNNINNRKLHIYPTLHEILSLIKEDIDLLNIGIVNEYFGRIDDSNDIALYDVSIPLEIMIQNIMIIDNDTATIITCNHYSFLILISILNRKAVWLFDSHASDKDKKASLLKFDNYIYFVNYLQNRCKYFINKEYSAVVFSYIFK
jgi:hypothetical protein